MLTHIFKENTIKYSHLVELNENLFFSLSFPLSITFSSSEAHRHTHKNTQKTHTHAYRHSKHQLQMAYFCIINILFVIRTPCKPTSWHLLVYSYTNPSTQQWPPCSHASYLQSITRIHFHWTHPETTRHYQGLQYCSDIFSIALCFWTSNSVNIYKIKERNRKYSNFEHMEGDVLNA